MKKSYFLKSTVELYKERGYSEGIIEFLNYLESRCENLGNFLEGYRHLQPNGKPFLERTLGIIKELYELREWIYAQHDEICNIKEQLNFLYPSRASLCWKEDFSEDLF